MHFKSLSWILLFKSNPFQHIHLHHASHWFQCSIFPNVNDAWSMLESIETLCVKDICIMSNPFLCAVLSSDASVPSEKVKFGAEHFHNFCILTTNRAVCLVLLLFSFFLANNAFIRNENERIDISSFVISNSQTQFEPFWFHICKLQRKKKANMKNHIKGEESYEEYL